MPGIFKAPHGRCQELAVELVIDLDSGEALSEYEVFFANTTIGGLFSEINSALMTRAYSLSASYHPTLGYPTYWGVSYSDAPDDGYSLGPIRYEPVDPSEPPKPLYDVALAKEELSSAKVLWEAYGSGNYNLYMRPGCLCPESSKDLMVVVRNWAVELVIDLGSGEALSEDDVVYADTTIDALFSEINGALLTTAYSLGAEYHPTLGYPTYYGVSYTNTPDDGYSLGPIRYEPVDPSEPPEPLYDVALAKEELSSAKDKWYANGSDNYDLRITPLCECPEDSRTLEIAVRNGAIESVIDGESGETLTEEHVSDYSYRTIDDLFEHLEHALSFNPPRYLSVMYHIRLGHPFYLKVIYQYGVDGAADDGFTLELDYHEPSEPLLPATTPEASSLPVNLGERDVRAIDLFSDRPGRGDIALRGTAA